uniref:Tegument protein UL24 n=1 Tax=Cardioderma bat herpesvirus TaxID=3141914 RepID=A0AAU7E1Q0_9VIRU
MAASASGAPAASASVSAWRPTADIPSDSPGRPLSPFSIFAQQVYCRKRRAREIRQEEERDERWRSIPREFIARAAKEIRHVANRSFVEFSDQDLRGLRKAARGDVNRMLTYFAVHAGERARLSWPSGWYVTFGSIDDDPDYDRGDLRAWGDNFACCSLELYYVGRLKCVLEEPWTRPGSRCVLLMSHQKSFFCFCEWKDESLYYIARDVEQLVKIGLRHVEYVYDLPDTRFPHIERDYQPLVRAWNAGGLGGLAVHVARKHGCFLPVAYPDGSRIRLCGLKCLEQSSRASGLVRRASKVFKQRCAALGIVYLDDRVDFFVERGVAAGRSVPLIVVESGVVFSCDVNEGSYCRLADSPRAFVGLGLRNAHHPRRFRVLSRASRHDKAALCPLAGH